MTGLPDSIWYPTAFNRSPPCGFDGVFDWLWVSTGVQHIRGITPNDIDCAIEINHFHLWIETKDPGIPISRGKAMQLNHAVDTGLVTAMAIWGKHRPEICRRKHFGQQWRPLRCPRDRPAWLGLMEVAAKFVESWAEWANSQPREAWRQRMRIAANYVEIDPGQINPDHA